MFEGYWEEAQFALQAVRLAAKLCRQIQSEMVSPAMTKPDQSPVTVADFASQALLGQMLMERFPEDRLVAEEDSQALRTRGAEEILVQVTRYVGRVLSKVDGEQICSWIDHGGQAPAGRFWTYDPIDGTKGFLRGDQYVSALALIEDGVVVVGALGCPNLNREIQPSVGGEGAAILAVRGEGCFGYGMDDEDPRPLSVSNQENPQLARLLRSFESGHTNEGKMAELIDILGTSAPPVLMDSQAKYAVIAAGGGDLLFRLLPPDRPEHVEMIWDHAAGSLLIEEAGGKVSDLRGEELDFSQGRTLRENVGVLASNKRLHEAALDALHRAGADQKPGRQP